MKKEIKKEILNYLDDVYNEIISGINYKYFKYDHETNNNKESEKINKILSLIDELQTEIYDLE
tara:strand:- start:148 stop:336 length:189 start_codon:yes stop_codon:yes gene_type:complete